MIALLLALQALQAPAPRAIAIEHVTVIHVAGAGSEAGAGATPFGHADKDRTVIIEGTRITVVAPSATAVIPAGALRVDGSGRFAIPGLWDMHVHADTVDLRRHLAWGITGVRDMGGDLAERQAWRRRIAAGEMRGPRILTPGPMLAGPPATASRDRWVVRSPAEARVAVDSLARLGVDFVKVHEGLTPEAFFAVLEAARAHRLMVAGHVPDSVAPAAAAEAKIRVIEHLEFVPQVCMPLFQTGALPTGCPEAWLIRQFAHFASNGTFIDPTITSFRVWVNAESNARILAGFRLIAALMRRARVPILVGTDQGDPRFVPGEGLHEELEALVAAGWTPAQVLEAATRNPAAILFEVATLGSVWGGHAAELVLLEGNPLEDIRNTRRISAVIVRGRLLDRAALDSLRR